MVFVAVCLLWTMVVALVAFAAGYRLLVIRRWRKRPRAPGQILSAEIIRSELVGPPGNGWGYRPSLLYEYYVAGARYTGSSITPFDARSERKWLYEGSDIFDAATVRAVLDRYPVGASVQVLFDPGSPAEAALDAEYPEPGWQKRFCMTVVGFFLLGALAIGCTWPLLIQPG